MSYENQTKKWAAKKFNLTEDSIESVDIQFDHTRGWNTGCDTCGYGDECDCELFVRVTFHKKKKDYCRTLQAYDMPKILAEIIDA